MGSPHLCLPSRFQISKQALLKIGRAQNLTKEGAEYVLRVIKNGPSRAVDNRVTTNVTSFYPSEAMAETRQSSSKGGERISLLRREFDPATFLWWGDQPEAIPIEGMRFNGKRFRASYTADLLDIERSGIYATEVKLKSELDRLCEAEPTKWSFEAGEYRYWPAVEGFRRLGIIHRVEYPDVKDRIYAENIQLLLQARRSTPKSNENKIAKQIFSILQKNGVMRLDGLLQALGRSDATPILRLIANRQLVTLLQECRLSFIDHSWIAVDERDLIEIRDSLDSIQSSLTDRDPNSEVPTPKEIERMCQVVSQLEGTAERPRSTRTLRRYKAIIQAKGLLGAKGNYVGNSSARLTEAHEEFINFCLDQYFNKKGSLSEGGTYRSYLSHFRVLSAKDRRRIGTTPVSAKTFYSRQKKFDPALSALKRGGRRASRAAERPTDPEVRNLPASRAYQIAHIDHCKIKLYIIARTANGRKYSRRAWLTFMVDELGTKIISWVLTFDNPSRRTCARVLRECIRKNGRLPEGIITDAGGDFRSILLGAFMAWKLIEKFQRPVAAGKFGRQVEGSFNMFLQALDGIPGQMITGNIKSRNVSKSHKPHEIAELDFKAAMQLVGEFVDWHNNNVHGKSTSSPNQSIESSLKTYPCSGHIAALDLETRIATSVPVAKNTVRIGRNGIHIQDSYYWCKNFAGMEGKRIPDVRTDPEDDSIIYVPIKGKWHVAKSNDSLKRLAANFESTIADTVSVQEAPAITAAAKRDRNADMGDIHRSYKSKPYPQSQEQSETLPLRKRSSRQRAAKSSSISWNSQRRNVEPFKVDF